MTADEKQKLYSAIGYDEGTVTAPMPEDYEAIVMNFKLVALEIGLFEDMWVDNSKVSIQSARLETIMAIKFEMAMCKIVQRPGANALRYFKK